MAQRNPNASFTRRKFTITETLDNELEMLADRNYQGNVSLCLRAAIEDHKTTLDGTDADLISKQLSNRVSQLHAQQEDLVEGLESIETQLENQASHTELDKSGSLPNLSVSLAPVETQILRVVREADNGLRLDDLDEKLPAPTPEIPPALAVLVDLGFIFPENGERRRYHPAGQVTSTSSGNHR